MESATPDLDLIKQAEQGARDRRRAVAKSRSGNPADGPEDHAHAKPLAEPAAYRQREMLRRMLATRRFEESPSADWLRFAVASKAIS
jgi:hypothetical protein